MWFTKSLVWAVMLLAIVTPASAQSTHASSAIQTPGGSETIASFPGDEGLKSAPENTMRYRLVGPFYGGRSLTATGVAGKPNLYYFGAAGGGVWKSTDGGLTWKSIFDKEGTASIGAIAVSQSDSNVIYVGTGEACIRTDFSDGDGVYKSVDGGKTWTHVGLSDTRQIGKIVIDPGNPDVVFVAALGHVYGPNEERGVFRSSDGGKTWTKVLYKDVDTGAIDITFDPHNSHILYAALWQVRRTPWGLSSGGPGSGIYKSIDGGTTWARLEGHGLPAGIMGRIGVAVGANSETIYALIEAEERGLYRSENSGMSWELVNSDPRLITRPFYFTHITADPKQPGTIYIMNRKVHKSTDGGHLFNFVNVPHGDNHFLWIDPTDSSRMIEANDNGVTITTDGGESWTDQDNQPTGQFYQVATDQRFPYFIYGAQQDNLAVAVASRGAGNIDLPDSYEAADVEAGYVLPSPLDPNVVYASDWEGRIYRVDKRSNDSKEISVMPDLTDAEGAAKLDHRFAWTAPLLISPHAPSVLYAGGERLFRTIDEGYHWDALSPDLTRNDKGKQQVSGGPITIDETGTEYYDTISTLAESRKVKGMIWVGTDDGLVHLTQDNGKSWQNVTPKDLPEWSRVSRIEASPHEARVAYIAVDRHENDDLAPYIYKTNDYGKTWARIISGIPKNTFVRVVREDPGKRGLLFAGTERGIFISYDDGAHWQSLQLNLPRSPVYDITFHDNDLVVATHGRGFWVLDDIAPLRQFNDRVEKEDVHLFDPSPAFRLHNAVALDAKRKSVGENPPIGAVIYFTVRNSGKTATLEILDDQQRIVRRISSQKFIAADHPLYPDEEKPKKELDLHAGLNRYIWDLRYDAVALLPDYYLFAYQTGTHGPLVVPGQYTVRLTVEGKAYTAPLRVELDPRAKVSSKALQDQVNLRLQIETQIDRVYKAVAQMQSIRAQARRVQTTADGCAADKSLVHASGELDKQIGELEESLIQTRFKGNGDTIRFPARLDVKLAILAQFIDAETDSAPTEADRNQFAKVNTQVEHVLAKWTDLLQSDVTSFLKTAKASACF